MTNYYLDKIDSLRDIFSNNNVRLDVDHIIVGDNKYPVLDDVIILLDPECCPKSVRARMDGGNLVNKSKIADDAGPFAEDIQFTFGAEWTRFSEIRLEYEKKFDDLFDLVDLDALKGGRACDLGCGTGRWSYLLMKKSTLRELVLVDFSEAIFVARNNLREMNNVLFFMADIQRLPFRENFADFLFSLGVLHHLPANPLDVVRDLRKYSQALLIYLYYALDNRPFYFRLILALVTIVRKAASKVRSRLFREVFSWSIAAFVYAPFIGLGNLLKPFGLSRYLPLYEENYYKNFRWWRLLAYDRFFTSIERRVSRSQIMTLKDDFSEVIISPRPGYWHFLCTR